MSYKKIIYTNGALFPVSLFAVMTFILSVFFCTSLFASGEILKNDRYQIRVMQKTSIEITSKDAGSWVFKPVFTVFRTTKDPNLALRPSDTMHEYNCPTWEVKDVKLSPDTTLKEIKPSSTSGGDGFDESIILGGRKRRTDDLFKAAPTTTIAASGAAAKNDGIYWTFPAHPSFSFEAKLTLPQGEAEPVLIFTFKPKKNGYYSVGYTGAPQFKLDDVSEIWQPMFWQEKRFPDKSYIALAFRCSIPSAFFTKNNATIGVVVDPAEFPFDPLPTRYNNRFGVAIRNAQGNVQPMVFAPVLGGVGSNMKEGDTYKFAMRLFINPGNCSTAFETIARKIYGFKDFRHNNGLCSLNQTLENEIDYGLSKFSRFDDVLKGCCYETDVPGAVKNVSSLNPLEMALVTDNEDIFRTRAYPIIEFLMSREKLLFSLNKEQKIQSPSSAMKGPCAPTTELAALYDITNKTNPVFLNFAENTLGKTRVLNLETKEKGKSWKNLLALYRATGDKSYLEKAKTGADAYIARRIDKVQTDFKDPERGSFWYEFSPNWVELLDLYEATGEKRYLDAAHKGARMYAMYAWMCPAVPEGDILVNKGGKAPLYWYLAGKGHKQMEVPEEMVPAWRLSEMGLVAEALGTSVGHRGVFMAHHARWMLRLSYYTGDKFLHDIARNAIIGRYCNFPGYHINTARTTAYEKADYPLREHKELSVNSFHYNHIWPHISILLDFLVTDAFARSQGKIDFPSQYIEGYAYLKDKFYGHKAGTFYDDKDVFLWMPKKLLKIDSVELNYIAARGDNKLCIALTNQSAEKITSNVSINPDVVKLEDGKKYSVRVRHENGPEEQASLNNGSIKISVAPMGITTLVIDGLEIKPKFQQKIINHSDIDAWKKDYTTLTVGKTHAMILNMGDGLCNAYVYLQESDDKLKEVTLNYAIDDSPQQSVKDNSYPFEFTVPLPNNNKKFKFNVETVGIDNKIKKSENTTLQR